jgi:hypothetical protein
MTTRIFKSSVKTFDSLDFRFDSSEIKRRNRNKKIKRLKKIKNFYQKNDLLRDRQNETGMVIPARPKTSTAIAIPNAKEFNIESIHGHWLLHSELSKRMQNTFITPFEGIADVNPVLVAASLSIKSIESPVLLSVFFGGR